MGITGIVTGAEVADLNADRSPEIYISLRARTGADKRMSLVAFRANNRKSLSGIYLQELQQAKGSQSVYCGKDQKVVVENKFLRRFPLCDNNKQPTGKLMQLQYQFRPGEAAWQLKLEKKRTSSN